MVPVASEELVSSHVPLGYPSTSSANVTLVWQAFPLGSVSLQPPSCEGGSGSALYPQAVENAISAPVGLHALYQSELLAAEAEFVRNGRLAPVDVPALVAAFLDLFWDITTSAIVTKAADRGLQAPSVFGR